MSRKLWLVVLFVVLRLWVLNMSDMWFDSGEYLRRMMEPGLMAAMTQGHAPLHVGYVGFGWVIYRVFGSMYWVGVGQVLLGLVGLWGLYRVVEYWFGREVARWSVVFYSLIPLVWVSQESVMMEAVYLPLFWLGWWGVIWWRKTGKAKWLVGGLMALGWAVSTHLVVLLWMTVLVVSDEQKRKDKEFGELLKLMVGLGVMVGVVSVINGWLMGESLGVGVFGGVRELYVGKMSDRAVLGLDVLSWLRAVRNVMVPVYVHLGIATVVIGGVGFWGLVKRRGLRRLGLMGLWLGPILIAAQWWDFFSGRHLLIGLVGVVVLVAYVVVKMRWWKWVVLVYLVVFNVPSVARLRLPTYYQEMRQSLSELPEESLVVVGHFGKPHYGQLKQEVVYVNQVGEGGVGERIEKALGEEREVFVTSMALSEPYGQMSGPWVHPLGLSYHGSFLLEEELGGVEVEEVDSGLYEVIGVGEGEYPIVGGRGGGLERINGYDVVQMGLGLF